jgi:integration host factor subunit beta
MKTITKKDLVDRIAARTSERRLIVKQIVQQFLDEIVEQLGEGNRLEFRDFGVFELKERKPRTAQNPKTMQKVQVPYKRTVKFKVGRVMKMRLCENPNGHAPHPEAQEDAEHAEAGRRPESIRSAS